MRERPWPKDKIAGGRRKVSTRSRHTLTMLTQFEAKRSLINTSEIPTHWLSTLGRNWHLATCRHVKSAHHLRAVSSFSPPAHTAGPAPSPAFCRMKVDGCWPSSDSKAMYMRARGWSDLLASPRCTVRLLRMLSRVSPPSGLNACGFGPVGAGLICHHWPRQSSTRSSKTTSRNARAPCSRVSTRAMHAA